MYERYIMGKSYWKEALPSMDAFAGAREYEYINAAGSSVRTVHMYTGSGLDFWVYPGRGMDIGETFYLGMPISFVSKNGVKNPSCLQKDEFEKNFFAGLVTTCGFDNAGSACEVEGVSYPTHGNLNLTQAETYTIHKYWEEDRYFVECEGQVRSSAIFGENLLLKRRIRIQAGVSKIFIKDEIINEGYTDTDYMLLYHCNFGYPVVSDASMVVSNHQSIEYLDEASKEIGRNAKELDKPLPGRPQSAFIRSDAKGGRVRSAICNPDLKLGVYVECEESQLDKFCQWVNLASADYAVGLEPAKNLPYGRKSAVEENSMIHMKAREIQETELEIGILSGEEAETYQNSL